MAVRASDAWHVPGLAAKARDQAWRWGPLEEQSWAAFSAQYIFALLKECGEESKD